MGKMHPYIICSDRQFACCGLVEGGSHFPIVSIFYVEGTLGVEENLSVSPACYGGTVGLE